MYFSSNNFLSMENKEKTKMKIYDREFDKIELEITKLPNVREVVTDSSGGEIIFKGFYKDIKKINVKITGFLKDEPQFFINIEDIFHSYTLPDKINDEEDINIFKDKNITCNFYLADKIMQIVLDDKITLTYPLEQVYTMPIKDNSVTKI